MCKRHLCVAFGLFIIQYTFILVMLEFNNLECSGSKYPEEMIELSLQSLSKANIIEKPGIYIFRMLFDPTFIRSHDKSPLWCRPGGSFFLYQYL